LRPVRWLLRALRYIGRVLLVAWASLAIFYSNLPWAWMRFVLAVAFAAFGIWALWGKRRPLLRGTLFLALFAAVVVWFASIPPLQDRPWRADLVVLAHAEIDGDRVRLIDVRDFDYRTMEDFTERYVTREVSVSHLTSLDFFVSYWMQGPIAHTFLSFNFDDAPPICFSIEMRREIGEGFAPIPSMFKQLELIYVVAEERDVVRVRTNVRKEDVFLYRIRAPVDGVRRLFLAYLERINELHDRPEWYHLLSSNCTLNIVRYANVAGRQGRWNIRHFLNGWVDRYLYEAGWLDTSLPFEELRERSHINAVGQAADDDPDFSQRIRANLPGMH